MYSSPIRGASQSTKSSSLAEALYPGNAGLSSAISAFDMTHNFSATYRYELPLVRLAPGKPRLAEGWQVSGLTRFGTGLPITLVNNNDTSLLGTEPNGINSNSIDEQAYTAGNLEINHRPGKNAFNTSLFSLPVLGTLGNARRRFFYGPGVDNTDLAVSKVTRLHESNRSELAERLAISSTIASSSVPQPSWDWTGCAGG